MANTANSDKWYFTKEQLENTPSRKCGYESLKELSYRQQAANFIQDMGQRLKVSLLCINTAIVYMHRFYVFHSFTQFPWHQMAAAALFLAAKVEEQPRKLEYVIRIANLCRNPKDTSFDINSERYLTQSQDLVFNENVLLQTLGFDVAIDHPHTHVVRCCDLVRASKDLAQTSYFMATYSLHLTTMCIQYKPSVVACFCILVACKWSNWEIPLSNEKKEWYSYVDSTVTAELLQQLTEEFLQIFENSPSRLKEKINATAHLGHSSSPMNPALKTARDESIKDLAHHRAAQHDSKTMADATTSFNQKQQQREREYRERKERERLAHQQQQQQKQMLSGSSKTMPSSSSSHGVHHRPPIDPKLKSSSSSHSRPQLSSSSSASSSSVSGSYAPSARVEPRDILREAARDSPFGIASKDYRQMTASEKDLQLKTQRDYLLKPNVTSELVDTRYCGDKQQRIDPNRASNPSTTSSSSTSTSRSSGGSNNSSLIKNKVVPNNKHDVRRHDEPIKAELDIKKHLSSSSSSGSSVHDKAYLSKMNSTSLKQLKTSPSLQTDTIKSVPKQQQQQQAIVNHHSQLIGAQTTMNKHHHNGGSYTNLHHHPHTEIKREPIHEIKMELPELKTESIIKEEPVQVKRPGLFSPEKSPPQMQKKQVKIEPGTFKQETVDGGESPRRRRHYSSSSSEPELRPVIKKIDQVEGFENLMRDTTIGMNKFHQIPDIITPISDAPKLKVKEEFVGPGFSKEMKPPDIIPPLNSSDSKIQHNNSTSSSSSSIVNGIETNPALISNLLKETTAPLSHLPTVNVVAPPSDQQTELKEKDHHHHHKGKKKNKEKHKHKDKDKSREEKDKKKKHKDKDREKNKYKEHKHEQQIAEPIKIKIHKDKIQPPVPDNHNSSGGGGGIALKIKIPKDKIKTESIGEAATSSSSSGGSLKIKIPKDVINNCNQQSGGMEANMSSSSSIINNSTNSRKRERDRNASSNNDFHQQPPTKLSKSSYKESKQNGRHPYKVAQMGDGDTSLHRLAESKYITKGSSS